MLRNLNELQIEVQLHPLHSQNLSPGFKIYGKLYHQLGSGRNCIHITYSPRFNGDEINILGSHWWKRA